MGRLRIAQALGEEMSPEERRQQQPGAPQALPLNSWGKQMAHAQSYFKASGGQLSPSVSQND